MSTMPPVDFKIEETTSQSAQIAPAPVPPSDATANPYASSTTSSTTNTNNEGETQNSAFGGLGLRPMLYLGLLVYIIGSAFLRSGQQPDTTPAAMSEHQHPSVNDNAATSYGNSDDDGFGEFGEFGDDDDDNDDSSISTQAAKKEPGVASNTEYSTSAAKISMHNIKVMFCTA